MEKALQGRRQEDRVERSVLASSGTSLVSPECAVAGASNRWKASCLQSTTASLSPTMPCCAAAVEHAGWCVKLAPPPRLSAHWGRVIQRSFVDCTSSRQSCSLSLAAFSQLLISQPSDERSHPGHRYIDPMASHVLCQLFARVGKSCLGSLCGAREHSPGRTAAEPSTPRLRRNMTLTLSDGAPKTSAALQGSA